MRAFEWHIFKLLLQRIKSETGHIGLNAFLHRMGMVDSSTCPNCLATETAHHVILFCSEYEEFRRICWADGAPATFEQACQEGVTRGSRRARDSLRLIALRSPHFFALRTHPAAGRGAPLGSLPPLRECRRALHCEVLAIWKHWMGMDSWNTIADSRAPVGIFGRIDGLLATQEHIWLPHEGKQKNFWGELVT